MVDMPININQTKSYIYFFSLKKNQQSFTFLKKIICSVNHIHIICSVDFIYQDYLNLIFYFWIFYWSWLEFFPYSGFIGLNNILHIYIYNIYLAPFIIIISSSSSSCYATSTDISDPISPLLPIVHRLWQVFRTTSRILT